MIHSRSLGAAAAALALTLLPTWAHAQEAMKLRQEVINHVKGKYAVDGGHVMAEIPELSAHLKGRWGEPNAAGTAESPRIVWIIRAAGDPLGNCVRVDARKYNKNTPGLEFKVLTGKCEMYQREGLKLTDG